MEYASERHIGDILKERNIILKGADAATRGGFTQVPNFLLKSKKLSSGDKMTFAMLLSYAWQNDYCFPGQERLAQDLGNLPPVTYAKLSAPDMQRDGALRYIEGSAPHPVASPSQQGSNQPRTLFIAG